MTAWETFKAEIIKGPEPGTCGRQVKLIHAAELFVKLLPFLENSKDEEEAFNKDAEVKEALLNRAGLREIGLPV